MAAAYTTARMCLSSCRGGTPSSAGDARVRTSWPRRSPPFTPLVVTGPSSPARRWSMASPPSLRVPHDHFGDVGRRESLLQVLELFQQARPSFAQPLTPRRTIQVEGAMTRATGSEEVARLPAEAVVEPSPEDVSCVQW